MIRQHRDMNLRQQLGQLLPSLLPSDPKEALKGTELIRLIRLKLAGDYSDASLRFHFSTLAGDPNSPIAKVEKSQGYYKRPTPAERNLNALQQPMLATLSPEYADDESTLEAQRRQKVMAIAILHYKQTKLSPYVLAPGSGDSVCDPWITPQLMLVDAPVTGDEDVLQDDTCALRTRQLLGLPPLPLCGVSLSISPSLAHCRVQIFRALSASAWAHSGELLYAEPVTDDALARTLRHLGTQHGLGITSLGLDMEYLDSLPPAAEIMEFNASQVESLLEKIDPVILVPSTFRVQPDAFALDAMLKNAPHALDILKNLHSLLLS